MGFTTYLWTLTLLHTNIIKLCYLSELHIVINTQQEFGQTPCGLHDQCIILKIIEHTKEKCAFRCIELLVSYDCPLDITNVGVPLWFLQWSNDAYIKQIVELPLKQGTHIDGYISKGSLKTNSDRVRLHTWSFLVFMDFVFPFVHTTNPNMNIKSSMLASRTYDTYIMLINASQIDFKQN